MADNAFVKIGTALLKHQLKKLMGEEALGVIGEELAGIGGDKLDKWLGDKSTLEKIEKAAQSARDCFHEKVGDVELEQYMHDLPLHNLPKVVEAIEELPTSPDESKLEKALRESIALNWKRLSSEQVDNAVNAFLFCLRSALLPIEKQTLMVIGHAVLRTEDKVNLLLQLFEKYIVAQTSEVSRTSEVLRVSLAKLPSTDPTLFGRDDYLKQLDSAWQSPITNPQLPKVNILSLVAWGGVGKTALVNKWLLQMGRDNYRGAERVYGWSFYSQGAAEGRQVSADQFIAAALTWFGDPDPTAGSPWDKGERLAGGWSKIRA